MSKSKSILLWGICFILSIVSLVVAFPILLFILYPYSVIGIVLYAVIVLTLSFLSFRKNALNSYVKKRILLGVLLIPVIVLIAILVSIEAGWLHFPS